jgi:Mor family transcriptional regulator
MVKIKHATHQAKAEAAKLAPNGRYSDTGTFAASDNDIIDDLLARVIALAPDFSAAIAHQVSREIRDQWAGDRVYISRRAGEGHSSRNEQIKRDHQIGERMALLQRRYHLSSRRLWEIIKA